MTARSRPEVHGQIKSTTTWSEFISATQVRDGFYNPVLVTALLENARNLPPLIEVVGVGNTGRRSIFRWCSGEFGHPRWRMTPKGTELLAGGCG